MGEFSPPTPFSEPPSFFFFFLIPQILKPLVSALQGRLVEVYFGFKKVEEVMDFHGFSHLEPSGEAYSIHFGCTI